MKNLIFTLLVGLIITGCKQEPTDSFVINGKAEGVYNGMRVYLNKVNERGGPIPIDTAIVMNETFSFQGSVAYPQLFYVNINGTPGRLPIIIENGISDLNIDSKILSYSSYTGSESYNVFKAYQKRLEDFQKEYEKAKTNLRQSYMLNDSVRIKIDTDALNKVTKDIEDYQYSYVEENSDNYGVLPLFYTRINSIDLDLDRANEVYASLSEEIKATEEGNRIRTTLDRLKVVMEAEKATAIGAIAPEFSAPNPEGEIVALKDVVSKGKITMIDFWAAWCGPCRRENPNMVKVYEKYHDKGLEIIGVGLDGRRGQQNPKEAWIKAINDDKLTWHQVSNLRYFDEIAKLYNVKSIPSMLILDNEGKILSKNLRGIALERKIAELLD